MRGCKTDHSINLATESNFDFLWVDWSTNGTTFTQANGWTGSTGGQFFDLSIPLGNLDNQAQAYFGFRLFSDASNVAAGAVLDNIELVCIEAGYDGNEYGFLQGTSMATPHVAGAAALLLAADPSATVAELRSALLGGVDSKASLSGQVATGGRLNLKTSIDLIVPPPDNDPPETNITSGPAEGSVSNSDSATFGFTSDEAGSTFECKLDTGAFESCTSAKNYSGLEDGSHTFSVQATDASDNTDLTPATRTWTIETDSDTDPPNTTINQGPSGRIKKRNAATLRFRFGSSEAGSTFKCKRNNGSWASCSSPKTYRNLPLGEHTFRVRATDQAGNTDPTPAKRVFRIVRN
jgi:subtilisin family serine protease